MVRVIKSLLRQMRPLVYGMSICKNSQCSKDTHSIYSYMAVHCISSGVNSVSKISIYICKDLFSALLEISLWTKNYGHPCTHKVSYIAAIAMVNELKV